MENEKILAVYPMDVTGRGGIKCYDVFFTNRRLIGSYVESRLFFSRFRGLGCILWGYYLVDSAIVAPLTRRRGDRPTTDPEQILKSHKNNFAWRYQEDIKAIVFKRKGIVGAEPYIEFGFLNGKPAVVSYKREKRLEIIKLLRELAPGKVSVEDKLPE